MGEGVCCGSLSPNMTLFIHFKILQAGVLLKQEEVTSSVVMTVKFTKAFMYIGTVAPPFQYARRREAT